ncbi:histidine phosphatase family protein [Arcanobacterium pinnipediorum]|uniref:Histidine phosphatase family protein n=1 Tax=Arcanobacterium pinnipediorum TaxID=1503041 RepID=A0ABY5AIQ1_9ACTO|nr:histidine phosphatase family protein [Arcanobacterium pinnipediorum]USR80090.1 histidine phosphatase family protein [Arcanobacterium pinnipediorum]
MKLIFVRHGQTYANERAALDTIIPGAALTELGWTQANAVVADLLDYEPDAIWRSDTLRTEQTATPLATRLGLEPHVRAGLREISAGDLEGSTDEAAMAEYIATMRAWIDGKLDLRLGGGDSGQETLQRCDAVIREVEQSGAHRPVIFAHAAIITFWLGMRASGITDQMRALPLHNTGIAVVEGSLATGYRAQRWMHIYKP